MRVFELYSGIGGYRYALNLLSRDLGIECDFVGYSEVDQYALEVYQNYFKPLKNEKPIADIRKFHKIVETGKKVSIPGIGEIEPIGLGDFDMLVTDVPCEKHVDDYHGIVYIDEVEWVVKRCRPQYVLIETPKNIHTHNHGKTLQNIVQRLEGLGYFVSITSINASQLGIPQDRQKGYIFATLSHFPDLFNFCDMEIYREYESRLFPCSTKKYDSIHDILEKNVKDWSMWISDQSKQFIFADAYNGNALNHKLNSDPAISIKPNMFKMQRANADNYYTMDFIETHGDIDESKTMKQEEWKSIKRLRRLTLEECCLLQGFSKEFFESAMWSYIPDTAFYKAVGGSTNVNMAYAVLKYIIRTFNIK